MKTIKLINITCPKKVGPFGLTLYFQMGDRQKMNKSKSEFNLLQTFEANGTVWKLYSEGNDSRD